METSSSGVAAELSSLVQYGTSAYPASAADRILMPCLRELQQDCNERVPEQTTASRVSWVSLKLQIIGAVTAGEFSQIYADTVALMACSA